MTVDSLTQLGPVYLRLQADRCQRLSRSCMDLGTARDLRLLSEEFFAEASKMELANPRKPEGGADCDTASPD
jgi:hypothetical protein